MDRASADWQELAKREPYFAVLTDERFLAERATPEARRTFFETGEADVAALFEKLPIAPMSALDFGCGVGRLTVPLARRVARVVGCDVAPAMLELARHNAADAGITNALFTTELDGTFDLICSLIVFQHIPVERGMAILERLIGMLAPGGVAVLHFTFRRPGSALKRIARRLRARFPLIHRIAARIEGDRRGLPYMQMNEYEEAAVLRAFAEGGCMEIARVRTSDRGIEGAILWMRR